MIKLVLPYPVSANRYWASMARGGRAITYVTQEAKSYKSEVGWIAKQAGVNPTAKPVEIGAITLIAPAFRQQFDKHMRLVEVKNGSVINLDNCLKVTFDALNGVAYVDDKQIKRIRGPIEYGEPQGKGALIIEVGEFVPAAPPLFAEVPSLV